MRNFQSQSTSTSRSHTFYFVTQIYAFTSLHFFRSEKKLSQRVLTQTTHPSNFKNKSVNTQHTHIRKYTRISKKKKLDENFLAYKMGEDIIKS